MNTREVKPVKDTVIALLLVLLFALAITASLYYFHNLRLLLLLLLIVGVIIYHKSSKERQKEIKENMAEINNSSFGRFVKVADKFLSGIIVFVLLSLVLMFFVAWLSSR